MAKYVLSLKSNEKTIKHNFLVKDWQTRAISFGATIQEQLLTRFGMTTQLFPDEDGMELTEGSMGMGKEWFNFRFRVFAQVAVYLDMLNVPMEWRDKGIGYYIIDRLKEFCAEQGINYIFLGSYDGANPFWEKCGFKKISEYPDFVLGYDFLAK